MERRFKYRRRVVTQFFEINAVWNLEIKEKAQHNGTQAGKK
jgi:hypothetical protein